MFFAASKIVGFVLTPSNAIALLCIAGILLLITRFRRSGLALVSIGAGLLAVLGWSPVPYWLLLPLSERFPAWQGTEAPDGIIVLGGAIDPDASLARGMLETDAASERVFAMLQLAHRFPSARIIYSGGSGNLIPDSAVEAPVAGRLLEDFGLANGRVVLEKESRTTEENATYTRKLIAEKPGQRWLLVTSAWHMPRAMGLYRKAGLDVEAYPVDFRSRGWSDATATFNRISYGLSLADVAVHEWVGLLAARLGGKSDDFFPAPTLR
jgi:uncharacterized SAM-binding protein YcdF (DUF218 family)